MRIDLSVLSLEGFTWTSKDLDDNNLNRSQLEVPGDGWCVRDAFCELMNWPENSDEWNRFVENPSFDDVIRLGNRLGLHRLFWDEKTLCWRNDNPDSHAIEPGLDHPGVVIFWLEPLETFHCSYSPDLRSYPHLPIRYFEFRPEAVMALMDANRLHGDVWQPS